MDEWEAKYKILASNLTKEQVEDGEKLLEKAKSLSLNSSISFAQAVDLVITAARISQKPAIPKEIFGFPVSLQEWMPAHYAAIFSSENIVITDLRTGEIRRVTKEVMERVVSKFFC